MRHSSGTVSRACRTEGRAGHHDANHSLTLGVLVLHVDRDERSRQTVKAVGEKMVAQSIAAQSGYPFDFRVLADDQTVNAFALPGGQIFFTAALLERLKTDEQLAAVLSHEVGHVIARHSAERLAKEKLTQRLTGAVVTGSGSYEMAQVAQLSVA